ncbi:DUF4365 domain-containing protein [Acinetobacter defluvii]|uniref:DUF4365 domain-containing protein n=1 Tax=Acinetobacter defluvii TaxID=1871111 RepID=A0A2S2FFP0_9GAMM|nr:DUF4365 domain-containing protein [Acinetobacter defluvii]AWL29803.1 DUF4365 domain-containing protein [Acinetobacter defluvii]
MRDLGQLGELAFQSWCAQVGLIANGSRIDKTGWDFFVEFPISQALTPNQLHKSAINCKIQVKATDKREGKWQVTLSNLRQMATSQMPSFYVFLEFDSNSDAQRAYIVHIDNDLVYKILKKIHQVEQSDKENNLNSRKMTLHYDESHELKFLNGISLKENLLAYIGTDYSKYINEKSQFLETCGFEDGYGTVQFSLNGEESIKKIIDVSLGLEEELDIENLVSIEQRFGIPSKKPEFQLQTAKLKIGMTASKKGKIRFKEDKLSSGLMFDINFYNSPFSFNDYRKYAKFRVTGDFFDMTFEPYQNKANYSFSLGDDLRLEVKKLKDAITLINLMSRDEQSAIIELELESLENILSFNLTSKFVERDLEIFNQLLDKVLQIFQYLKIYDEICISLKELYFFNEKIEQFHTIITKASECNVRVEFGLNGENRLKQDQMVHISVSACRLGSHVIGIIFSVFGKPIEISENRYRLDSSDIKIERIFTFTAKDKSINESIQEGIDKIILMYDEKYDVVFNWGDNAKN